jgi:hypothetical protein
MIRIIIACLNDGRFGVVRILAYYARRRGFDSRTVQTFLFVLGLGVYMYNMNVLTKNNVCKFVFIRYLESITQALYVLTLDKRVVSVLINKKINV